MKTRILATLFAFAFATSIGFPAAAADDASGVTSFYASGPSASTERFQSLSTMSAVQLSPKDFAATPGASIKGDATTPIVSGPVAGIIAPGITKWDLTPEDFVNATR